MTRKKRPASLSSRSSSLIPHPSSLIPRPSPLRLLIAALLAATLAAAFYRYQFETRRHDRPVPLIEQVRNQLRLHPILAAEAALRERPDDPALRLRLADASAAADDPVGAALALSPLLDRINRIDRIVAGRRPSHPVNPVDPVQRPESPTARYLTLCLQIGWPDEAEAVLQRLFDWPPGVLLEVANAAALHGDAPRAIALLATVERQQARELGADDCLNGAMTWYQCRRPGRAAQWAEKAVQTAGTPELLAARALQARCRLAAGEPQAALRALPAKGSDTTEPLVQYWRARAGLQLRDPVRRLVSLEHLTHLGMGEPPDPPAAFEAGRAHLLQGNAEPAALLLSRAASASYQAVLAYELLTSAYTRLGQPARADWARGRAQNERGQFRAAAASLQRSLKQDSSPVGAWLDLARALTLAGEPRTALEALERAQKRHPESLDLALSRAEALNQLDRFSEQATALEAAAALDPGRAAEPLRNLGRMYHETRQYDRMAPVLERALKQNDADAEAHRLLGLAHALRPDDPEHAEKAILHLLRAAALDPADSLQWTSVGAVLHRMGHPGEAAACYRRAIAAQSWADGPYVPLAQAMQRQGRSAEAKLLLKLYRERRALQARRRQLENRVTANRADANAHFALGDLLLRHVSFRQAYPYLLIAASLRPEWKQAQLRLADVSALLDYADLWQRAERAAR